MNVPHVHSSTNGDINQIWTNWLISNLPDVRRKFGDDSLSKFYGFKRIEGKSATWGKKSNEKKMILLDATQLD